GVLTGRDSRLTRVGWPLWRVVTAMTDRPPTDLAAAAAESAWPPIPPSTESAVPSTLTWPSKSTSTAVFTAMNGPADRRPMSWVYSTGYRTGRPAAQGGRRGPPGRGGAHG